jgi:hypothetical protein
MRILTLSPSFGQDPHLSQICLLRQFIFTRFLQ